MATPHTSLPHASADIFLTDGGMETTLLFVEGYDLPCFAAFDLFKEKQGCEAIKNYYRRYLNIAKDFKTGFILESATWRASPDWLEKMNYPASALASINEKAVQLLVELKEEFEPAIQPIILSGNIGPRGDGYKPENMMTADEAEAYHAAQVNVFRGTPVDMISAFTLNYVEEAIGITRAAAACQLPVVISFTLETDGMLPTGMPLQQAIGLVDESTAQPPLYFMINCAHPDHFSQLLADAKHAAWAQRIKGLRANASCKSHAELDAATELDRGHPQALGMANRKLKTILPQLNVFGGCCGTDEEHVTAIAREVTALS